jgi:hypothetical protein
MSRIRLAAHAARIFIFALVCSAVACDGVDSQGDPPPEQGGVTADDSEGSDQSEPNLSTESLTSGTGTSTGPGGGIGRLCTCCIAGETAVWCWRQSCPCDPGQ